MNSHEEYHVGDRVVFSRLGVHRIGKIVGVGNSNRVRVLFDDGGREDLAVFMVRKLSKMER